MPSPKDIEAPFRLPGVIKSIAVVEPGGTVHMASARLLKKPSRNKRIADDLRRMMERMDSGKLSDAAWVRILERLNQMGMVRYDIK